MPITRFDAGGLYPVAFHANGTRLNRLRKFWGLRELRDGRFDRKCVHCGHEFRDRSQFIFLCKSCKRYFQTGFVTKDCHGRKRGKGRDHWEFERKRFLRNLNLSLEVVGLP